MSELDRTLNERANSHGSFKDVACINQNLKDVLHGWFGWQNLTQVQREALESIMGKISRIMSGSADHADHWHDIQGYARLAEVRCKCPSK